MLGDEDQGPGVERQKQNSWNVTGRMIDFWTAKWKEVHTEAKKQRGSVEECGSIQECWQRGNFLASTFP
jgi:hypothetical protein